MGRIALTTLALVGALALATSPGCKSNLARGYARNAGNEALYSFVGGLAGGLARNLTEGRRDTQTIVYAQQGGQQYAPQRRARQCEQQGIGFIPFRWDDKNRDGQFQENEVVFTDYNGNGVMDTSREEDSAIIGKNESVDLKNLGVVYRSTHPIKSTMNLNSQGGKVITQSDLPLFNLPQDFLPYRFGGAHWWKGASQYPTRHNVPVILTMTQGDRSCSYPIKINN